MRHIAKQGENLYICSMGKKLRITAMFTNEAEANQHMEKHPDDAVIACFGVFVLLANQYDKGI